MKKQLLLKPLLTLALVMICGSAWGKSYTISFLTAASDGSTEIKNTTQATTVVDKGTSYVTGFTSNCSKAYYKCVSGVKIGSKSAAGTLEMNVDFGTELVSKITVKSEKYLTDTGTLSFYANGAEIGSGKVPGEDFSYTFTEPVSLSSLKFVTSEKRAYVSSVIIETTAADVKVTGVSLDCESLTLKEGTKGTLVPTVAPADASNTAVTWTSSNESVATVVDGVVTAVAEGTATITVKTVDGSFTDECEVTVIPFVHTWANTYTSNVALSTEGGTSASACKAVIGGNEYDGIKAGTGKVAGAVQFVVPAYTQTLHVHIGAWKGETVEITVSDGSNDITSFNLVSDDGINSNSPFALQNDPETDDYFTVTLNTSTEKTLTFTATSGNRFVIFGVNAEQSFDATISDAKYATLCLPFNFTVPEGVTAYTAEASASSVALTAIEGVVPANTGVIIYSETPGTYAFTGSAEAPATLGTNNLVGVTAATELAGGYILAKDTDGTAKFFTVAPNTTLAANKAYLDYSGSASALSIRMGDATGIRTVEEQQVNTYFDLMGRKVQNPERGIYILNGKKVFVK